MLKRTVLFDKHVSLGAKMVPFAGWEMPIYYPQGIIAEHKAVRTSCGVFDVGHMGLIKVLNPKSEIRNNSEQFLNYISTNDVSKLKEYSCQYSVICNEEGGVVDDVLIYKLPDHYMMVVNASNTDKVLDWFSKYAAGIEYEHMLARASIAVQGPRAEDVIASLFGEEEIRNLKKNRCLQLGDILISRTGYTGEDGFEIYAPKEKLPDLWDEIIEMKVMPCGLGARDTLRLEAGLPLYGHEYNDHISPLDAGYSWAVKFDKGNFIGKEPLLKGATRKLVGIELSEKSVPREGFKVYNGGQDPIGEITSGTFSPTLEKPIALAYIYGKAPSEVAVEIRGRKVKGQIVALPFYRGEKR